MKRAANETSPPPVSVHGFAEWSKDEVEQSVARRFERRVEMDPERLAVKSAGVSQTYGDLNRTSNRVAHGLLEREARMGQRVALLMAHDGPLIAAMLGVLKAGKTCVVLAPAHPDARLASMLEDSGAEILVTDATHLARSTLLAKGLRAVLDFGSLDDGLSVENPGLVIAPDTPAFIIYTSGSTGRARGVIQNHRNVLHNTLRHTHGLKLHAGDRIALLASVGTGQGMATAFCALLNGATLCPRDLSLESVAGLAEWLAGERVTVYISAATVFRHFALTLKADHRFPDLRMVRLASEPVHKSDLDLFRVHFEPHCVFANTYSSTETGNLCQFHLAQQSRWASEVIPVGHPVEDMEILVWDENGQPVEPGVGGEIVVKSRYLSPGYWNEPGQTRAAFLPAPDTGERIYRTRDLGRLRPDGILEHLGRMDNQLKIRGFRVYPDEIEHRLCRHPAIAGAHVDARADAAGNTRLVAYFVPREERSATARELRGYLKESLPDFMVPSAFVPMDALPRTPNGKVDRDALRLINPTTVPTPDATPDRLAPLEELLAGIWADVLDLDTVGIHENFFELGGDSLLVTQLLCRVKESLHLDLPLAVLFENPSVAELANRIQERRQDQIVPDHSSIRAEPRDGDLPLSFAQERAWRHSQSPEGALGYLLPNGYLLDGPLDHEALQRALDEMVRRHESLRTTFHLVGEKPCQRIGAAVPVKLGHVDLIDHPRPEEEAGRLWRGEARRPIDLANGPMLRATLLRLGENRHQLLLTNHHIITDAWSRDIFLRELGALYAAFSSGRPSPLPENKLHYADFAVWQRRELRPESALYQVQLEFWKKNLAGAKSRLTLPILKESSAESPNPRDGIQRWSIPAETARKLRAIGRREGTTLFMSHLAAFAALLHRLARSEDIVIGSYLTNRNRPETHGMIGFFSNLLMLRVDLTGNPSFLELLARVRHVTLAAAAHGDIPYDELCADLRRAGCRPPEVQILFEVKYGTPSMRFGNLELRRLERKQETMPWGFQLNVENQRDQSVGRVLFDSGRYDPVAVQHLLSGFENLLADAAAHPERRLSEFRTEPPRRHQWWPWR